MNSYDAFRCSGIIANALKECQRNLILGSDVINRGACAARVRVLRGARPSLSGVRPGRRRRFINITTSFLKISIRVITIITPEQVCA
jgi:hypothetical protein